MHKLSGIAALVLVSSLAIVATGCNKKSEDQSAVGTTDSTVTSSSTTPPANEPTTTESSSTTTTTTTPADTSTGSAVRDSASRVGESMENKAEQAGQAIDDAAITTSVKGKYLADSTLKGRDISVETNHGVVTLTGTVQSDSAKEHAAQVAQDVKGVVSVTNQLKVKP